MGELCIMTCDKIMLMFGLGKYVEKAMELKIQFAPLTKYQMDLVENRDKYEARLKAVEQEYRAGKRPADYEPVPEKKTEVSPQSYMARQGGCFCSGARSGVPGGRIFGKWIRRRRVSGGRIRRRRIRGRRIPK